MEFNSEVVLKLLEFAKNPQFAAENLSISIKSSTGETPLLIGESQTVESKTVEILIKSSENTIFALPLLAIEGLNKNFELGDIGYLKLLVSKAKLRPLQKISTKLPKCEYLKRLQTIENTENEVKQLLNQIKFSVSESYQNILETSPLIPQTRLNLKKKPSSPELIKEVFYDYEFLSYFDVNLENISSNEEDLLQNVALGLLTQNCATRLKVKEFELCQESLSDFEYFIKNLGDSLSETKDQCKAETETLEKKKIEIEDNILSITQNIEDVQNNIKEIENEKLEVLNGIKLKKLKNEEIRKTSEFNSDLTLNLRKTLENELKQINDLENEILNTKEKFFKDYSEAEMSVSINEKILALAELQRCVNINELALQESINLQSELLMLEGSLDIENDLKDSIKQNSLENELFATHNKDYQKKVSEIVLKKETNTENSKNFLLSLNDSINPLKESFEVYDQQIKDSEKTIKSLVQHKETLDSQTKKLKFKENPKILQVDKSFITNFSIIDGLSSELDFVSDFLLEFSDTSLVSNRFYRTIENTIETQDLQHLSLHKLITMIKDNNPSYVPIKNDSTDIALAEYLNSKHDNLEVNFKRIDKQLYTFGTTRVGIKVEGGIFVNFEGKVVNIEEFLEKQTQIEKEKIVKRRKTLGFDNKNYKTLAKTGKSPLIH